VRATVVICVALVFGCDPPRAPEARLVIQSDEALRDRELSLEEREVRLAELRSMPLKGEKRVKVRDACVGLHEALLEADRLTKAARARVDAYERVPGPERDPKEGAEIASLLGRSHAALRRSEMVRDECIRGIETLKLEE
jgi:hypothetical protein